MVWDNFWPLDIVLTSLFRQKWLILSYEIPQKWPFLSIFTHFLQISLAKQSRFVVESPRKVSYGLGINSESVLLIKMEKNERKPIKNGHFRLILQLKWAIFVVKTIFDWQNCRGIEPRSIRNLSGWFYNKSGLFCQWNLKKMGKNW